MKKPAPPAQSEIDKDLAEALKALGADVVVQSRSTSETVLDALTRAWTGRKGKPPNVPEVAKLVGYSIERTRCCLKRLVEKNLVLHPSRDLYIPRAPKHSP